MKHQLRAISLTVGLLCASSSVFADDLASIYQGGTGSTAAISQTATAGGNRASIYQSVDPTGASSGQVAYINQSNVSNSDASIMQTGSNSTFAINQHDGADLHAEINTRSHDGGDNNVVNLEQSGTGASASLEQSGGTNNQASIVQLGNGGMNGAQIIQYGSNHVAGITQVGSNFMAAIQQTPSAAGAGNTAIIYQHF